MKIFESLPVEVRRALAARELRRRGAAAMTSLPPDLYRQLSAGVRDLLAAVGPGAPEAVHALLRRLETGGATDEDLRLLASLPEGPMAAAEIVALIARVDSMV